MNGIEKLNELIERRKKYLLLPFIQRKIYQHQFEEMQKEIIQLKLIHDLYQDELDFMEVTFNYGEEHEKIEICEVSQARGELKWFKKCFNPNNGIAKYVALIKNEPLDNWLRDIYITHIAKREGYIDCPWPNKIESEE